MKPIKQLLKQTHGYTLAELLISITIFAIGIIPIYQIMVNGAKIQNVAEETYEATLHGQALLQDVKDQIEKDLGEEYRAKRGLPSPGIKDWLKYEADGPTKFVIELLEIDPDSDKEQKFKVKYDLEHFLYEVHIWPLKSGKWPLKNDEPVSKAISFMAYHDTSLIPHELNEENTWQFTRVEIEGAVRDYFNHKESIMWTKFGTRTPKGIGEIISDGGDGIKIKGNGIKGEYITIEPIEGYPSLEIKAKLTYQWRGEDLDGSGPITHELIIENENGFSELGVGDMVQLSVDLTTFSSGTDFPVIRVENRTKATVVMPVYNEKNPANVKIYPRQENEEGKIVVENKSKLEPSKNFIIGIIVKDAYNSAFGDENKVLSKLVDVYSYDYNKQ